uniref:NADH dehydrogenase subunit 7 n=1 Tax=Ichthyophthirius multifiliis TaxID=5932 RepID=G1FLB9_ICHMU|nr:NADH dehydrogenase subunit 7 [Ichthyophthirius multifiliis]AEL89261.1 NADH dehydrogenase subunit 7 [Ichthyophthirius multifiliis]
MNRSIFQIWKPNILRNNTNLKQIKLLNLNFGPQHPAAHGVLRLIMQLNGEIAERFDPHIGLLHRGSEKLIEDRPYLQGLPYFDRMDYVSMMVQEHAYCLGIENLLGTTNYSSVFTQVRTLYDELTRILNHLLAVACHALDVGSMSSVFWAFEEREKIMEFYERVCGARMHAAFYRPNEVNMVAISNFLIEDILEFSRNFFTTLNEMHNVLSYNKIWKQRLINIGVYSQQTCFDFGLTGVMARCTGLKRDLRLSKTEHYSNYYYLNFRSFIGQHGDSYDRFLIRMNEMSESLNIINQNINKITKFNSNDLNNNNNIKFKNHIKPQIILNYLKPNNNTNNYNTMESLINHFKNWSSGIKVKSGYTYQSVESPKGEFGITLISDGSNKPYKCKIRSPAYHHLQVLPKIGKGHFLADIVTLIGTIDIVFGEIDR